MSCSHTATMTEHIAQPLPDEKYIAMTMLAIPSAVLSILGSCAIICMVCRARKARRWTPYNRLLLGMSICDIILSLHLALGNFMRPEETSNRVWAFGNDATCTASGFFGQLSLSAIIYNGMLSLYFLLSARFRWSNKMIATWIEPLMHIVSIGYPLVTATVGAVLGVFSEPELGLGCVVNDYPRNCGEGPGKTGEYCVSVTIGWIFMGIPRLTTGTAIVCNNVAIWAFVRRQTRPVKRQFSTSKSSSSFVTEERIQATTMMDVSSSSAKEPDDEPPVEAPMNNCDEDHEEFNDSDSFTMNPPVRESGVPQSQIHGQREQHRRLYLIRSQAFLYVGSYFLCNFWVGLTVFLEGLAADDAQEMQMAFQFYPILILYSFFAPLQGFFNMLVFMRPTYAKQRHHFPEETRLWAFRRTLLGNDAVSPNGEGERVFHTPELPQPKSNAGESTPRGTVVQEEQTMQDVNSTSYKDYDEGSFGHAPNPSDGQNHFVSTQSSILESSLILSIEEESHDTDYNNKEWTDQQRLASWEPMQERSRQRHLCQWGSSLETISELSQLSFVEDAVDSDRWNSGAKHFASGSCMPMTIPERPESSSEDEIADNRDNDLREPPRPTKIGGVDSPICVPRRKLSPQPASLPTNNRFDEKHSSLSIASSPMNMCMDGHVQVPQRKLSPVVASQ